VVSARVPHLTAKLQGFGTTIFAEMSTLAVATDSINLGQGFPDTDGPRRSSTRRSPRSTAG
jgi:N-succinyldiaminopimelate aminotransferase